MKTPTEKKYRTIERDALKAKLDKKEGFKLWNVLSKAAYKPEANIPGSAWVPVESINAEVAGKKIGSKDETVVVYCGGETCESSTKAATKLVELGYTKVFTYEGGVKDWTEAGNPLARI